MNLPVERSRPLPAPILSYCCQKHISNLNRAKIARESRKLPFSRRRF
jgi:hypothetical protein